MNELTLLDMMNNENGNNLEWLLDYELKQSIRHRRFVSLVMLSANGNSKNLNKILKDIGRDTDPVFLLTDAIAVLMGETDTVGALRAVERYREMSEGAMDVQYSVASFPDDGRSPDDLIHKAHRRLELADEAKEPPVE